MSTSVYTASLIEQRPSLQLETWRDIDLSFDTKPAMDNNWQVSGVTGITRPSCFPVCRWVSIMSQMFFGLITTQNLAGPYTSHDSVYQSCNHCVQRWTLTTSFRASTIITPMTPTDLLIGRPILPCQLPSMLLLVRDRHITRLTHKLISQRPTRCLHIRPPSRHCHRTRRNRRNNLHT